MRISTAGMHRVSVDAILEQQTRLATSQMQLATGRRFQNASEDPIGAARVATLERTFADNEQFSRNSDIIESRLNYEEQSLADATLLLQRARELALQGANSTLGIGERQALANDVRQQLAAILDVANRSDGNGEYLFSGTSTSTKPFAIGPSGTNYLGDATTRQVRLSHSQALADGHAGSDVFMNVAEGNGTFRTVVNPANTGGATIDVGRVSNPGAWVADNYTLSFTSPTDWQVVDDTTPVPNVVASGSGFTSGQSLTFLGVTVTLTGTPATGDSFAIEPARQMDMFAMLDELATALVGANRSPSEAALFQQRIGASIANLDRALDRTINVRSEVGARLEAIDTTAAARDVEAVDLQSLLSDLRDVDYAETISKLNQQYTGLQAIQASYTRFAQLSLFDFLR